MLVDHARLLLPLGGGNEFVGVKPPAGATNERLVRLCPELVSVSGEFMDQNLTGADWPEAPIACEVM